MNFLKNMTNSNQNLEQNKKESKEYEKLKIEFEICQKTAQEYLEGWKKERAEFINYKKDEKKRMEDIVKFSNERLILNLLEVLDNFEIAEKKLTDDLKSNNWIIGVLKIKQLLIDILKKENLEEIKTIGEKFDPRFHESVAQEEIEGKESGEIIEEIRKGYILNSRVIRPAKVRIAK